MKKILFAFILIFLFSYSSAQEFLDNIAQEVCECINSKEMEEMTRQQIENQVGACLLHSIGKNKKEFDEYSEGKSIVELDMESFGEEVGIHMAVFCPQFFLKYVDNLNVEADQKVFDVEIGQIISIESQLFNIIHFKSLDGSLLKFLWLYEFEGEKILTDKKFKNKKVSIQYDTFSLYDPKSKSYINYRVIDEVKEVE